MGNLLQHSNPPLFNDSITEVIMSENIVCNMKHLVFLPKS